MILTKLVVYLRCEIKTILKMIGYIYLIRNVVNHKVYVGQTKQSPQKRWNEHIRASKSEVKRSPKLYNAINKYGLCMFDFEVISEVFGSTEKELKDKLNRLEIYFINYYKSTEWGYNLTTGGNQVANTSETIMKISKTKQKKNKIEFGDRQYFPFNRKKASWSQEYEPGYLDIWEANELNDFEEIQFWV